MNWRHLALAIRLEAGYRALRQHCPDMSRTDYIASVRIDVWVGC